MTKDIKLYEQSVSYRSAALHLDSLKLTYCLTLSNKRPTGKELRDVLKQETL